MLAVPFCFFVLTAFNAYAVGLGGYLEYVRGWGTLNDYCDDNATYDCDDEFEVEACGFGFVFDTNVSKDAVFNYRLQIGYSGLDADNDSGWDYSSRHDEFDGYRISFDNTFGFGIVKTSNFRLWLGPQIHLNYSNWDMSVGDDTYDIGDDSLDVFGFGTGFVLGMNFNLPGVVSICPEIGIRYQYNWADSDDEETTYCYHYGSDSYCYDADIDQDFSYDEWLVFFKINLLFRLGENG